MIKNIAIVAGGFSGERPISLKSAAIVKKSLDPAKYNGFIIDISEKRWALIGDKEKKFDVDKTDFSVKTGNKKLRFDCVFMAIHGTPGEDGRLQGYFDMLGIPYTSCGQGTSALTANKGFCNKVVGAAGVLTSRSMHLFSHDVINEKNILKELRLPVFVKPNNGGSSVGMSKVNKAADLKKAITRAFKEDKEVLIEEFVKGTEITCGVMRSKGKMYVFPITEIVSKKEFFDYEAKYSKGMSEEITPARISVELEEQCKATSCLVYNRLNCKGVVRMDYIASNNGLYFLEVNTVPGMTDVSIVPQQARAFGFTIEKLFSMMIEDALWKKR
ncbi:MAG: D-alanine--D-alanine ligase [Bacteroidota bacterium]